MVLSIQFHARVSSAKATCIFIEPSLYYIVTNITHACLKSCLISCNTIRVFIHCWDTKKQRFHVRGVALVYQLTSEPDGTVWIAQRCVCEEQL